MTAAEGFLVRPPISPWREMGAYEALWSDSKTTFKRLADQFRESPDALPSDLVSSEGIAEALSQVEQHIEVAGVWDFGIRIHGSLDYPERLRDAAHPVELLYFRGCWDLIDAPKRIAVVGSRAVSKHGAARTRRLVTELVNAQFIIVSGLAKGVDAIAHRTAIKLGSRTIGVIGTPITDAYPSENAELQEEIARDHLLVSQVPIWRYSMQDYRMNRLFFPERNATMSAIALATVIVEASNTSGTLAQARAALHQGRKLFILNNCFEDPNLTWPQRFEAQGAIRVKKIEDIIDVLG